MRRIVITGMGAVSPIGNNINENLEGLKNGICGIDKITYYDTTNRKVSLAAEIKNLNLEDYFSQKELKRMDKFVTLALIAAREAMENSNLSKDSFTNPYRVGISLATGVGGLSTIESEHSKGMEKGFDKVSPYFVPGAITNIASAKIAIEYGIKGFCNTVVTACAGGTNAIGEAYRQIKGGYSDIMICGGSESCITEFGIGGFTAIKALSDATDKNRASIPFDIERNGFVMGEGAGVLILEELEHAKKRNAKIYAELIGYGANCDAYHVTAPSPDGSGAAVCMKMAMEDAGISPTDVDYINAHGTSTRLNDSSETNSIKLAFGEHAYKLAISSTKSMTGHLLGASGAIEAIYSILAITEGYIPPTINYEKTDPDCDLDIVPNTGRYMDVNVTMSNSLGFGGHNASLIFRKYC
ncbi:MAG: beta-ketoacyl-ACP synthase II [Wujia sp.]